MKKWIEDLIENLKEEEMNIFFSEFDNEGAIVKLSKTVLSNLALKVHKETRKRTAEQIFEDFDSILADIECGAAEKVVPKLKQKYIGD